MCICFRYFMAMNFKFSLDHMDDGTVFHTSLSKQDGVWRWGLWIVEPTSSSTLSTGLGVMVAVDLLGNFGHILSNCALMDAHCCKKVNELHQNLDILISQFSVEPDLLEGISNPL